jgi:hypothetical protein
VFSKQIWDVIIRRKALYVHNIQMSQKRK